LGGDGRGPPAPGGRAAAGRARRQRPAAHAR
jgi:hypothetical protein